LTVTAELTGDASTRAPRACDCSFCTKHGAMYLSDAAGALRIEVREPSHLMRYRQGSGNAEMLLCQHCGVLVAVVHDEGETLYGAVNATCLANRSAFALPIVVSPAKLSAEEKIDRWKKLWFRHVQISLTPR
jgi:hypothetical protein